MYEKPYVCIVINTSGTVSFMCVCVSVQLHISVACTIWHIYYMWVSLRVIHPFCSSYVLVAVWIFTAALSFLPLSFSWFFTVLFTVSADTNAVLVFQLSALCLTGVQGSLNVQKICFCMCTTFVWVSQAHLCVSMRARISRCAYCLSLHASNSGHL